MDEINRYSEEMEIDLIDFLYKICLHYKKIIAVGVLGMFLGAGFAMLQAGKENRIVAALMENREQALEDYADDITEKDLLQVDVYQNNLVNIDKQMDYLNNSVRYKFENVTQLQAYDVYLRAMNLNDVNGVLTFLNNSILNDDLLDEIAANNGINVESKYYHNGYFLRELFGISSISDTQQTLSLNGEEDKNKLIRITVTTDNADLSRNIGEALCQAVLAKKDDLRAEFGTTMRFINDDMKTVDGSYITNAMNDTKTKIVEAEEKNGKTWKGFSKIQQRYYAVQPYAKEDIKIGTGKAKMGLIGLMAGAVAVCGWYAVWYLFSGCIHTEEDLRVRRLKIYGIYQVVSGKNRLVNRIFRKENGNSMDVIAKKVSMDVGAGVPVLVATTLAADQVQPVVDQLQQYVPVNRVYSDILANVDFLEAAKGETPIVYVEQLEGSKQKAMDGLLELQKDYDIVGSGVILLEVI